MEMKALLIRLRPETHKMLKGYCNQNRLFMGAFIDSLIVKELSDMMDEAERLDEAQRNAGSIS